MPLDACSATNQSMMRVAHEVINATDNRGGAIPYAAIKGALEARFPGCSKAMIDETLDTIAKDAGTHAAHDMVGKMVTARLGPAAAALAPPQSRGALPNRR